MKILVTGATGTVGRNVIEQLLAAGADDVTVRALTRRPETAELPQGVEVVAGDLASPETVAAAFDGVDAVHFINFAGGDYSPLAEGRRLVELAVQAGVQRATVLGGRADGELEIALTDSVIESTLLMPVEFMSNTLQWWAQPIRESGVIREPFGDRVSAMVHPADIGAVAARVLLDGGHGGEEYVLTGPEAVHIKDKVRILADATGRDIEFVELSEQEARGKWAAEGMPGAMIDFLIGALGNTPEVGRTVVPTVERLTGRPARTFAQWAEENADAFRH
jgi:uncharacterized protein YbjT (DUF2867 family)